jgi:hypothetical protein
LVRRVSFSSASRAEALRGIDVQDPDALALNIKSVAIDDDDALPVSAEAACISEMETKRASTSRAAPAAMRR